MTSGSLRRTAPAGLPVNRENEDEDEDEEDWPGAAGCQQAPTRGQLTEEAHALELDTDW